LGAAAAVLYVVVAPPWYAARLTVLPSTQGGQMKGAAAAIAERIPAAFDTSAADVNRIEAVLHSDSVTDEVIKKFDLGKHYGTAHIEDTRAAIWGHCATAVERKSGLVALTCEDKDPKLAMDMTAQFGLVGNLVFRRISESSASEERKFLEAQVAKARKDVDESSRKLREFQENNKIVDLPEQSKAVISAMASIKGELISKQLELSYLSSFSARGEASVQQLQQQIAVMESKLAQLETSEHVAVNAGSAAGSGSGSGSFFPGVLSVPELRFQLEQLLREQKIQETVFFLLTQRYETAKVDEARDTSTFQILDTPTLPTKKSRPNRKKTVLMGTAGGFGAGVVFAVFPVWWRRRKKQTA
jgi:capsule polysaccharide export protein KpsE/RkpR